MFRRRAVGMLAGLIAGCGGRAVGPDGPPPLGPGGTVITWGDSLVLSEQHSGNLQLLDNVLGELAEGRGAPGDARMLYTKACDPRLDPDLCKLATTLSELEPFLAVVRRHGQLEFHSPSEVDLARYDFLIFEACSDGEPSTEEIVEYLRAGGRALILANYFCRGSVELANEIVEDMGLTFRDMASGWPVVFSVPPEQQQGLLQGVSSLEQQSISPQTVQHSFTPIVQAPIGMLMARRHEPASAP